MAKTSKLPEVRVEAGQCPACGSTHAKTYRTGEPFELAGEMIIRRWRTCTDCGQNRVERTPVRDGDSANRLATDLNDEDSLRN